MTIKTACRADFEDLVRLRFLAHQYSAKFDKEVVISEKTKAELAKLVKKELNDPRIIYLLAKEGKQIVGMALLSLSEELDRTAFLGELFVEEKYRKKRVGKQLIEEAIRITKDRGLKTLRVTVAKNNKFAQIFYAKLKFHPQKRNYILLEKKI